MTAQQKSQGPKPSLQEALNMRFEDAPSADIHGAEGLSGIAARGSCRSFADRAVPDDLVDLLCAVALSSPSKSDLQQRDIVVLRSAEQRASLAGLVSGQAWVAGAPMLLVFCGNNRRQRLLHDWHELPFANDHCDAPFNAACDAAIALGAFVTAAEAVGLGCCPISAVRNEAQAVSALLDLPRHVFPFAGLALGFPAGPPSITMRLPLRLTCHMDRYCEEGLRDGVAAYDQRRADSQPYGTQRLSARYGEAEGYGWSLDKARQYSVPERAEFGAYMRAQGFCFD
ncbi:MAG: nitroreductase family protein [Pseudomonadota bacterium]